MPRAKRWACTTRSIPGRRPYCAAPYSGVLRRCTWQEWIDRASAACPRAVENCGARSRRGVTIEILHSTEPEHAGSSTPPALDERVGVREVVGDVVRRLRRPRERPKRSELLRKPHDKPVAVRHAHLWQCRRVHDL